MLSLSLSSESVCVCVCVLFFIFIIQSVVFLSQHYSVSNMETESRSTCVTAHNKFNQPFVTTTWTMTVKIHLHHVSDSRQPQRHRILERLTPDDWHLDNFLNEPWALVKLSRRLSLTTPKILTPRHQLSASFPVTQYEKQQLCVCVCEGTQRELWQR